MFELLHVGPLLYMVIWDGGLKATDSLKPKVIVLIGELQTCILVYAVKSTRPVLTYDVHLYESLSHQYLLIQQLSERMPLPQPNPIKKGGGWLLF